MSIPVEDQAFLAQFAQKNKQSSQPSLLDFAKANNLLVTAGFAHGGHNPGSKHYQGDAQHPGAIDVDYKGVDLANLRKLAAQQGYQVSDERTKTNPAWTGPHYHIQQATGPTQRVYQSPNNAKANIPAEDHAFLAQFASGSLPESTTPDIKTPSIYANDGDTLPDILVKGPPDLSAQIKGIQSMTVPDLQLPQAAQPVSTDSLANTSSSLLNRPRPQTPPTPGVIEGLGNIARQVGGGLQQGAQSVFNAVTHPGDLLQQGAQTVQNEAQHTQSPLDVIGGFAGGAAKGVADVGNSVYDLKGSLEDAYNNRQHTPGWIIPTGALEQYLQNKGASSFIGGLAPWAAAEVLSGGEASIPLAARLAKSAGTGAAFGAFAQPGDLGQRAKSAIEMGAAGLGLGAAGEAFGAVAKRLFPEKVPANATPEQIKTILTPEEQALIDKHLTQNPDLSLTGDEVQALRTGFKERGGEITGAPPKGNLDAQILGPDGRPVASQSDRLKSSFETALERSKVPDLGQSAPQIEIPGESRPVGDLAQPGEPLINTASDLAREKSTEGIIKPGDLAKPEPGKMLEFPGKTTQPAEPLQIVGPSGRPIERPVVAEKSSPFGDKDIASILAPEQAPEAVKTEVAAKGGQLINIADAQQFVRKYMPQQLQHLLNIVQAARQDQTANVSHKPLSAGGQIENAREISPVAIEKRTIAPRTEVNNLRKEFSPAGDGVNANFAAIRDNLVQRLNKAGVKVNAKQQNVEGVPQRTAVARLNSMAQMLPEHERTHIYVYDHNFGETARGQAHGVRRLDRITDSSLTGNKQNLPSGTEYHNQIAPTFKALDDVMSAPDVPDAVKKAIKQLGEGKITKQGHTSLRTMLMDLPKEVVQKLCRL